MRLAWNVCAMHRRAFDRYRTIPYFTVLGERSMEKQPSTVRFSGSGNGMNTVCKKGLLKGSMEVLHGMDQRGILADPTVYARLLQECANTKALSEGKQVHFHMIKMGCEPNVFVGNNLVNMYAKCGKVEDARHVFDKMLERSVVSWNAMIAGYIQNGVEEEALKLFRKMCEADVGQTQYTFASVLRACAGLEDLDYGRQVHALITKTGIEMDVFGESTLVDMYVQCYSTKDARHVFDKMTERDVVSWTAMIAGYVQDGNGKEALILFGQMLQERMNVNRFTFTSVLGACAGEENLELGKQVHASVIKAESEPDAFLASALVDMYAKCTSLNCAHKVFDRMAKRNEVLWMALITGYARQGRGNEALQIFEQMHCVGIKPNHFTFANVLSACAIIAALERGRRVHSHIIKSGFEASIFAGNALLDMYAKCGSVESADKVFEKMPKRNIVSWNAMIAGYAQHGQGTEALKLFEQMQQTGTIPDHITFVGVLSACSHAGLVDEGRCYFDSMGKNHSIAIRLEHCACMVDLFGRAGLLQEAEAFINAMEIEPDALVWRTLLAACRIHGNTELGKHAANCLLELEPYDAATYVLLSNMYTQTGSWDERAKVRKMMMERRVKKKPGCSWIDICNRVYTFVIGDRSHPQTAEIYASLERLTVQMKEAGYFQENKHSIHHHSEKLAIVCGLINTFPGTPIRVIKNLRVCGDCHNATKFISQIVGREIIVRDANRFHHFSEGLCSCRDYW